MTAVINESRAHRSRLPLGLLRDMERPAYLFRHLGPNWFASIMGTGIVANAAATLPWQFPGLRTAATVVWALASVLLVGLVTAWAVHWTRYRPQAQKHAADPVMAQFYGAPPMALLTVGAGTLLLGKNVIGLHLAVDIDWVLWAVGTVTGLVTSWIIPYLMMTRHSLASDAAFGGWLMPVVPPMVSAATGSLLIPYAPPGQARLTLLLGCYAMFGISLIAALVITTLLYGKLMHHSVGAERMVPTLWIVLGPLGQSVTAANLLAAAAPLALPALYAEGAAVFGFLFGLAVWGFAMLWLTIAAAITVRTVRRHLPFSLTWWSFTFPVGTCVTGTTGLAARTHAAVFTWWAVALYALLVIAWLTVAARTARGSLRGHLFLPPGSQPAPAG